MDCRERLEHYLGQEGVAFEIVAHDQAYTMQEVAAAAHISGKQVAKVVMVKAGEELVMFAIPAASRLNLDNVRALPDKGKARLAKESAFAGRFPDCAPGAMPPFGNLYDVPVYVDQELTKSEEIVFRVGTHQHVMKVAYADYARLVRPMVGEFAYVL